VRTVAYLRVSTTRQAREGLSLEAQKAKIQAYAELYDLKLVATVRDEGKSARNLRRPGVQKALKMLRGGKAEGLLVVKLDRLTRSIRDLTQLIDRYFRERFALLSVSEQLDTRTAAGRMMINIICVVSQWERETIGERTSEILQFKKGRGELVGSVPYGYRLAADGVHLEPDEEEQIGVTRIFELAGEGCSLREICAVLAEEDLEPRGTGWYPNTVRRILRYKP
jgi:DNA invertase Pin-like site-specific DNA recombinase